MDTNKEKISNILQVFIENHRHCCPNEDFDVLVELHDRLLEALRSLQLPSKLAYEKSEDKLDGCMSVDDYEEALNRWNAQQDLRMPIEDFFGLDVLRSIYHLLIAQFEPMVSNIDEKVKRRYLRRLEEYVDSLGRDHQGTLTKMGLSFIVNTVTNSNDLDENEALLNTAEPPKRGQLVKDEERKGVIEFRNVENDGKRDSLILLTGVKNIYQKQLPKMPREYIARLVYDRNHSSMVIAKKGLRPVGGITYRVFPGRKFAEIVFCAITSTEQVKGYGSQLMNHLKNYVRNYTDVEYFLTYADNYAIGYFKKQGFTTDITLDRSTWAGFIKDYEGGTIMLCSLLPKVEYLIVPEIIEKQKRMMLEEYQKISSNSVVHPGLTSFDENGCIDPKNIPGLVESGWYLDMGKYKQEQNPLYPLLRQLLSDIQAQTWAWPFVEPVNPEQVPDYYTVIKEPMDLKTIDCRVETDYYKSLETFKLDFLRMVENCRVFNDPKSVYVKCANKLETFFKARLRAVEEYQTAKG